MAHINNYNWACNLPPGWQRLYVRMVYKAQKIEPAFTVTYCKEKYGTMRVYFHCPNRTYDRVNKIVMFYEDMSAHRCSECGKTATVWTTGWIMPYCDKCIKKFDLN